MAAEDWLYGFDGYWPDESWDGYDGYEAQPKTCHQCGATGLFWKKTKAGFQLYKGRKLHECDFTADFEKLEQDTRNPVDMIPSHPIMRELLALSKPEQCLVHRFLYYVLALPVLDDRDYDMLERDALQELELQDALDGHAMSFPGSDIAASYAPSTADLAYRIASPELR